MLSEVKWVVPKKQNIISGYYVTLCLSKKKKITDNIFTFDYLSDLPPQLQ